MRRKIFFTLFLTAISGWAQNGYTGKFNLRPPQAQVGVDTNGNASVTPYGNSDVIAGLVTAEAVTVSLSQKEKQIPKDQIRGECGAILDELMNQPSPCRGVELVLLKPTGEIVDRVRTNTTGEFQFIHLKKEKYSLQINSDKFKLAKNLADLEPGQLYRILVKREK